jgi:hypothetical protein
MSENSDVSNLSSSLEDIIKAWKHGVISGNEYEALERLNFTEEEFITISEQDHLKHGVELFEFKSN